MGEFGLGLKGLGFQGPPAFRGEPGLASAEKPFEIAASELNKVLGHAKETRTLRDRDGDVRRCGRAPNYEHGRSATNRCLHWSGLRGWTAVMPDCLQTAMRSQSQRPCFA